MNPRATVLDLHESQRNDVEPSPRATITGSSRVRDTFAVGPQAGARSGAPMPWGITVDDLPGFLRSIPNLEPVTVQTYADPFPHRMRLYWLLSRIRSVRPTFAGSLVHARASAA